MTSLYVKQLLYISPTSLTPIDMLLSFPDETTLSDIAIECNSNNIKINVKTGHDNFNGMIYPKGLSKNSSCLMEYEHAGSSVTYILPLRSCNTMNHDVVKIKVNI